LTLGFQTEEAIFQFELSNGVFNPNLGHFSKKLLEYSNIYNPNSVLDIGTGCGYYSVFFSIVKNAEVVATDIDNRAIECAKQNFSKLNCNITALNGYLYEPIIRSIN